MCTGERLCAQLTGLLPWKTFHRIVTGHGGDQRAGTLPCSEPFRMMAFAHRSYREVLSAIEVG